MNDKNKILTVSDLALLVKVNRATIYNYIKLGLLYEPNYKVGLNYYYNLDDLSNLKSKISSIKLVQKDKIIGRPINNQQDKLKY